MCDGLHQVPQIFFWLFPDETAEYSDKKTTMGIWPREEPLPSTACCISLLARILIVHKPQALRLSLMFRSLRLGNAIELAVQTVRQRRRSVSRLKLA